MWSMSWFRWLTMTGTQHATDKKKKKQEDQKRETRRWHDKVKWWKTRNRRMEDKSSYLLIYLFNFLLLPISSVTGLFEWIFSCTIDRDIPANSMTLYLTNKHSFYVMFSIDIDSGLAAALGRNLWGQHTSQPPSEAQAWRSVRAD